MKTTRRSNAMKHLAPLSAIVLLAACSQSEPGAGQQPENDLAMAQNAAESAEPMMTNLMQQPILPENETMANIMSTDADAAGVSANLLSAIVYDDLKKLKLLGAGCSFHANDPEATLAVVTEKADGAVKLGQDFRKLTARKPGEEYITAGPIMQGDDAVVVVTLGEGSGRLIGIDTRGWPASMRVSIDDKPERTYQGEWQCGA